MADRKTVLIDLSGTIHIDDKEISGSIQAVKKLRNSKVNVKFVTNTTKESKRILFERLKNIGFEINQDEIFTSLSAAFNVLRHRELRPYLLLDDRALEDFVDIPKTNPNCVVVGLAPDKFGYEHMNTAFKLILEGAPLMAVHKARYYKRTDGLALGPGPFISGLEYSTGITAEIIGKPSSDFFMSSIKEFDSAPTDCFMIGDDVRDDIGGAQNVNMKGFLVKTGKYRIFDELKINPPPYKVVDAFPAAVDIILSELS